MDEFLRHLISPPALFFTIICGAAMLYWLMVILGALDLDILHFGHGDSAHGVEAGHGDGHGDDGGGHHLDGHGLLHAFFEMMSVGKVPVTIILSLLALLGWMGCMLGQIIIAPLATAILPNALFALLLFAGAVLLALPLTALGVRPLRGLFSQLDTASRGGISLVGRLARITSVKADAGFGTAVCVVDGAELILNVLSNRPELVFAKGQEVVIASWDDERQCHRIGPAPRLAGNAGEASAPADTTPPTGMPVSTPIKPIADPPRPGQTA